MNEKNSLYKKSPRWSGQNFRIEQWCWRYNQNLFCSRHPYGKYGTCKKHCIHTGSCCNCSFRNITLYVMTMHCHGIPHQLVVIPPRRMLPTVAFFRFTCVPDSEVYVIENKDSSLYLNPAGQRWNKGISIAHSSSVTCKVSLSTIGYLEILTARSPVFGCIWRLAWVNSRKNRGACDWGSL